MKPLNIDERTPPPLFDVGAVWTILWQRRMVVLASIAAVLLMAFLHLLVTKPSYTATASILIDPRDARATNFNSVLPAIGTDSAAVASQVFVIESRDLLLDVFNKQGLENDPEFSDPGLLSRLGFGGPVEKDSIFKRFQNQVSVERAGLTYVINISFKSRSSDKAAHIANVIVDRYRASLVGEREAADSDVNSLLAGKISGLQQNVSDAERSVEDFKSRNQILDSTAGGTLQSQIDQITDQLIVARGEADQVKDQYDQALAAGSLPVNLGKQSEILSSSTTDKLRDDYNRRATELANNQTVYQPRHPLIRRLQSELDRTEALMAEEAQRITRELKAKYDLSVKNVATIQAKLDALRQQTKDADIAQVELRQLTSKSQAARTVLDNFMKRAEETSQLRGLPFSEARVISAAAPPAQPTWPKPLLLLPVSAVLGLVAGCGLALVLGPVRTPKDEPPPLMKSTFQPVEAENAITAAPSRPEPVIANFGVYRSPGGVGHGANLSIRAIRRRFFQTGNEPFSRDLLLLVRRIIQQLSEHPKPYVLLVSSLHSALEPKLAGAMIGIGLQQAEQNVLMVEFSGQPGLEISSHPARRGAGVFVNGASGLHTVVYPAAAGRSDEAADRVTLDDILADAGTFDFVLLMAPSITGAGWDEALFADADLMLFALGPTEEVSEATELLQHHLDAGQIGRSATLVIAPEDPQPSDIQAEPQNLAAGQTERRSGVSARR